jgi:hypothetical protein
MVYATSTNAMLYATSTNAMLYATSTYFHKTLYVISYTLVTKPE